MGIFSNFKINSLRKKIEGDYESRLERIILSGGNLPQKQKMEIAINVGISMKAIAFAKFMNHSLFHPDFGVFRNDVSNLNEFNFNQLFQVMAVWYIWESVPMTPEGMKNQGGLDNCTDAIVAGLGISLSVIRSYYSGLAGANPRLVNFVLYRWCMLAVGHVDNSYEAMHENSPDCQKFISLISSAKEDAEKALD